MLTLVVAVKSETCEAELLLFAVRNDAAGKSKNVEEVENLRQLRYGRQRRRCLPR